MLENQLFNPPLTIARRMRSPLFTARSVYRFYLKRLFDTGVVILLAPFVLPLVMLLACLVRRDGGPAFFGHSRVGFHGRTFRCWKLRSMCLEADTHLAEHLARNPAARAEWDARQKLENDPRVTRLGHFLRQSSLDELPQLWNVLTGEMSLVGPRPVTQQELVRYGQQRAAYLSVLPGITGLWQVSGRNGISYAQRVRLDAVYANSVSLWLDFGILCRTVIVVLQKSGV